MVSPARRRETVKHVQGGLKGVSQRRACKVLTQARSTQRYRAKDPDRDRAMVSERRGPVRRHPRYGYRRVWALLRQDGWTVNRKRGHRLWRREGFKVPAKQRKKRRLGTSANGIVRHRAEHKDHVWCYDFVKDQTTNGRPLKFLPIEDEYTRECLALEVARSLKANDVVETLRYLFEGRGAPKYIRSDNGPEFIAEAIKTFLKESGVATLYIEPGSPWQNAYSESFNSRFRDEMLDAELFTSVLEAKVVCEAFQLEYNHRRPHSGLDYQTPAAFATACGGAGSAPFATLTALRPPLRTREEMNQDLTLIASGT